MIRTQREAMELALEHQKVRNGAPDAWLVNKLHAAKVRLVELLNRANYLINGQQFAPAVINKDPNGWYQAMLRFFRREDSS